MKPLERFSGRRHLTESAPLGLTPRAALEENDAHSFFEAIESQVICGPTLTNVNDFGLSR